MDELQKAVRELKETLWEERKSLIPFLMGVWIGVIIGGLAIWLS